MKKYVKTFGEELNESTDFEMAKSQLAQIEKFAKMLSQKIQPGQNLAAWVQSQIAVAANDLNGIYQYMEGEDLTGESVSEKRSGVDLASLIRRKEAQLKKIDKADATISRYQRNLSETLFDKRDDIDREIKKLQKEYDSILRDMENDPEVLENPTDGSNRAVIAYGEEMERVNQEIKELRDEKAELSIENDPKLARMEDSYNNLIDELDDIKLQIKNAWALA